MKQLARPKVLINGRGWGQEFVINGHVQPNGNYHYHGLPESLINKLGDTGQKMVLMGYAADGFPIYGRWGYSTASNSTSAIKRIKGFIA